MDSQGLPTPEDKTDFVRTMFDAIAQRYDLVNRLITLGLDHGWRQRAVSRLGLERDSLVLDLGCGTGDFLREMTRAGHPCIGVDLSFAMLLAARTIHAPVIEADAHSLPISQGTIDGVISGFALRNFTEPKRVFQEVARILVPGGRFVILEVDQPSNPIVRFGHGIWFNRVVPLIGALFSDAAAYRYLPRSVAYLPGANEMREMLVSSGFTAVRFERLQGGLAQIIIAEKRRDQR